MDRKYQVTSATTLMRMNVTFNQIDGSDPISIVVSVDYANDRIFFEGDPIPNIDYDELQEEILAYLRPPMLEAPELPKDILQRIQEVQSGKYGTDLPQYQGFTR